MAPVLLLAAAVAVLLLLTSGSFRYSGDELYFLAAGRHLDWGYVDQPPLVPLLARLADLVAPGSATVLRLPATLAVSGSVVLVALLAKEFGGGRRAQLLTAGTFLLSPTVLGASHHLSTLVLDLCAWSALTWLLARWVRTGSDRLWLAMGGVTAVALENKFLVVFFWVAVAGGLLIAGPRDVVRRPMVWFGAGIAVLSAAPGLIWQAAHGWPQVAMGGAVAGEVSDAGGRLAFVPLLLAGIGLIGAVLTAMGLRWMFTPPWRSYRFLAWATVLLAVLVLLGDGRPYYLAGLLPVGWAVAAVEVERRRVGRWSQWPAFLLTAVFLLRGVVPLDVEWMGGADRYVLALRDFDWPALTDEVADVYHRLPAEQRSRTVVIADDYGRAGVLAWYGPQRGLPSVYSGSRGYWYFGAPPEAASTVIYVGPVAEALRPQCTVAVEYHDQLAAAGAVGAARTRPLPISLCTGVDEPWTSLWPRLRHL